MKKKKVTVSYQNKTISIDTLACSRLEMGRGLMFRSKARAPILFFDFGSRSREVLHSFFVFFPFLTVWVDGKRVVETRIVSPFRPWICPQKPFTSVIEIPLHPRFRREIDFFMKSAS